MNFNKYHVSKNLFDSDVLLEAVGWKKNDNIYSGYSSALHSKFNSFDKCIPVDAAFVSMNIMFKYANLNTALFIVFWYTDGTSTSSSQNAKAGEWTYFSAKSDSNKILKGIAFSFGTNDLVELKEIMLNSGSEALPYEPYSSEVWHDTPHYIHNTSTDTITTLPAVVYANGTTATVGLKGNMSQDGTPTPSSPIQPSECGELEENVAIIDNRSDTITNGYYKEVRLSDELPAGTYTISFTMDSKTGAAYASSLGRGNTTTYQSDISDYAIFDTPANINRTITLHNNACIWARFLRSSTPATFSYSVSKIAIVSGDTPYGQYKIPISSANTTTPVYLGEVETTRRICELVLTGSEEYWSATYWSNSFVFYNTASTTLPQPVSDIGICSHFLQRSSNILSSGEFNIRFTSETNRVVIGFGKSGFETLYDWKEYLAQQYAAGTPVCVWYVLATEETGIVNEPLRKIGTYADEVSGITIPTIAGANTISVGTTLQPSEVTVNYKGWHPVESVHERDNGQWD